MSIYLNYFHTENYWPTYPNLSFGPKITSRRCTWDGDGYNILTQNDLGFLNLASKHGLFRVYLFA